MNKAPFQDGRKIIKLLRENGYQAYFVGGAVRDYLLQRPIHDIDLVTSAAPEEVMEIFPKVIPLGIEHGTVIVRFNDSFFEVTTFRYQERVSDNNIIHESNIDPLLYNDLKHRDFTMNAMAMDVNERIIDPFLGQNDLNNKIIRGVHNSVDRLAEDPLRILRAFRFASEFGFAIDQSLLIAIKEINPQIKLLAPERISQEFSKIIQGQYVQPSLESLIQAKTFRYLPMIQHNFVEFLELPQIIKPLNCLSEFFALMNYLNHRLTIKGFVKEWKISRKIASEANHLLHILKTYKKDGLNAWLIYCLGRGKMPSFIRLVNILFPDDQLTLQQLESIYLKLPITSKDEVDFSGKDLRLMFSKKQPGQWIQSTLSSIEKNIVNQTIANDYPSIKEWVKCHPPEDI